MSNPRWIVRRQTNALSRRPDQPRALLERLEPRVLASATPLGGPATITTDLIESDLADLASRGDGSTVVAWAGLGDGGDQIQFQRFSNDGNAEAVQLGPTGRGAIEDIRVAVSNTLDGLFVIGWTEDTGDFDNLTDIFAQLYSAAGAPMSDILTLNSSQAGDQSLEGLAMAGNGNFVALWEQPDDGFLVDFEAQSIFARLFDGQGEPISNEIQVNQQLNPGNPAAFSLATGGSVTMDDAGDFVVGYGRTNYVYQDYENTFVSTQVLFERFDPNGASRAVQQLAFSSASAGTLVRGTGLGSSATGTFWLGWNQQQTTVDGDGFDQVTQSIIARRYSVSGSPQGGPIELGAVGSQSMLEDIFIDVGPAGDLALAISRFDYDTASTVTTFRRFTAAGVADGAAEVFPVDGATAAGIAVDSQARFALLYSTADGLFVQRYGASGANLAASFGTITPFPAIQTGQSLSSVQVIVSNTSDTAASGMGTVTLTASPADTTDDSGDDVELGALSNQSFAIAANGSKTFLFRNIATTDLTAGQWVLRAFFLSTGQNAEAADDIALSDTLTVADPFVDLSGVLVKSTLPTLAVPGDRGRVTVQLLNSGNTKATGRFDLEIFARPDDGSDDVLLGAVRNQALAINGGAGRPVNVNVVISSDAEPGSFTLVALISSATDTDDSNNELTTTATDATLAGEVVWQFGQVGTRRNVKLVLLDDDGEAGSTKVTLMLSGPGTGELIGLEGAPDLQLTEVTNKSSVRVITDRGGDGRASVNSISADGELRSLDARNIDILGSGDFLGLTSLTIGNALEGSVFNFAGPLGSFTAGRVESLSLDVQGALGRVRLLEASGLNINADRLTDLTISGDRRLALAGDLLDGSITLNDETVTQSLGRLTVKGALTNTTVQGPRSFGAISANTISGSALLAGVTTYPASREDFPAETLITSVSVKGVGVAAGTPTWIDSVIAAWSIGAATLKQLDPITPGSVAATSIRSLSYTDSTAARRFAGLSGADAADLDAVAETELQIDLL